MNKINDTERTSIAGQVMDETVAERPAPRNVSWQYAFAGLATLAMAGYLHKHGDNLGATVMACCLSICLAIASFRQSS